MLDVLDDVVTLPEGRRIGFRVRGGLSSRPIVYFHGQPGSRLEAELIPDAAIEAAGACLVSFDRPGMGRSDLIPARDMTIDVEDAISVADHLGIGRFAVMGVSAGGPPAFALAATHPERVERAVLCCASGPYDDEAYMPAEDIEDLRRLRALGADGVLAEYEELRRGVLADVASFVAGWFAEFPASERDWITSPPAAPAIVVDYTEALRQGARGWLRETEVRAMPWTFDPATITSPVAAFHGGQDEWELVANIRRVVDRIPGATLTVYAEGNHLRPLMHPDVLLAAAVG